MNALEEKNLYYREALQMLHTMKEKALLSEPL